MNPQVFAICKILQGDNEHSLPTDKWDDVRYQALQLASLSPYQDFFRPSIDANQRNVNPMVSILLVEPIADSFHFNLYE